MEPVVYRRRRAPISRGEREWRVEEDALVTRLLGGGGERRYAWKDIVSVRLCFDPTRAKPWRYVFALQPRHARRVEIDNAHCVGGGGFENRSSTYTPFVRAALERVAAANPKARALYGETPKRYFFLLLMGLLGLGAAAFALIALPTPFDALPGAGLFKLGLIVAMLLLFWVWLMRALPRGVAPDAVPERAFPPEEGGETPPEAP